VPGPTTSEQLIHDRYFLLATLGQGAMGVVYRGRDTLVGREVALKEIALPSALDDAERADLRSRIMREARAAVGFSHPGAVRVYDVVDRDGSPVVVMEMVYAPTLEQLVKRGGPLRPEQAAAIGLDLIAVLEAAHAQGIVHRHVAPCNVVVPPHGPSRLADFGITPFVGDPKLVASGNVGAAPHFFAPEQLGNHEQAPAVDIWGVGATLWFALEGESPFVVAPGTGDDSPGGASDVLAAIAAGRLRIPHRAGALQQILESMMAADPEDRPDLVTVRADLRVLAAAEGLQGGRAGAGRDPIIDPEADDEPPPLEPLVAISRMFSPDPGAPGAWAPVDLTRGAGLGPHDPPPPPWPVPHKRLQKSATILCSLVILVLVALLVTNGRLGRGNNDQAASGGRASQVVVTVPRQWDTYTEAASGAVLSHPPDWVVTQFGSVTRFQDPSTGAYLQVTHREPPGASPTDFAADAEKTRFPPGTGEYDRVRMIPTKFANSDAVIWEFTYEADLARQREIDIGFNTRRYGFTLEFRAPYGDWPRLQPVFAAITSSFSVPL